MPALIPYVAEDRSLLLPLYRKLFIQPLLPHIPRSVSPNALTHVGHAVGLVGLATLALFPDRPWAFYAAAASMQLYLWFDNADGAHARATGQSSALGEFLDHGLDAFSVAYIAVLTCMSLGLPAPHWLPIVVCITGGAILVYFEQAITGVFRLGLLNQTEALLVLSSTLTLSGLFGSGIWERLAVGPVTARLAIFTWTVSTLGFGILHGLYRVARRAGLPALAPTLPLLVLWAGLAAATATGTLEPLGAVALAIGINVHAALDYLVLRLRGEIPRVDKVLVATAVAVWASVPLASPEVGRVIALAGSLGMAGLVVRSGWRGLAAIAPPGPASAGREAP